MLVNVADTKDNSDESQTYLLLHGAYSLVQIYHMSPIQ